MLLAKFRMFCLMNLGTLHYPKERDTELLRSIFGKIQQPNAKYVVMHSSTSKPKNIGGGGASPVGVFDNTEALLYFNTAI